MTRADRPFVLKVVCSGRGRHRPRVLRRGLLHNGHVVWKDPLVEVNADKVFLGDEGYRGRFRFPCRTCGPANRVLLEETVINYAAKIAEATQRERTVVLDVSLLP